jgi:hypothetical protein
MGGAACFAFALEGASADGPLRPLCEKREALPRHLALASGHPVARSGHGKASWPLRRFLHAPLGLLRALVDAEGALRITQGRRCGPPARGVDRARPDRRRTGARGALARDPRPRFNGLCAVSRDASLRPLVDRRAGQVRRTAIYARRRGYAPDDLRRLRGGSARARLLDPLRSGAHRGGSSGSTAAAIEPGRGGARARRAQRPARPAARSGLCSARRRP